MAKNNNMTGWIILIAVVVVGYFLIAGNPFAPTDDNGMVPPPAGVVCNKDYTASVSLMSRNAFERASLVNTADTMVYKVWKLVGTTQIPQPALAEGGELKIGFDEQYLVVAMTNASLGDADVRFVSKTFEVDAQCNSPKGEIFYLESVPSDIEYIFEHSRITGPNAVDNTISVAQEGNVNVRAILNGQSRTKTEAIIVFDVERTQIERIDSSLAGAKLPNAHTAGAGERSYAFELGTFDGAKDLNANFDFGAHRNALTGDYNVTFTIYQYQTGYENTRTGDWVSTKAIEDNDDEILMPTVTGTLYLTITS
jgi:hypothetical protein